MIRPAAAAFAGARQAVGDHVVDHQPDRPAPVAPRVEARVGGVLAGDDVANRARRARSIVRGDRRGARRAGSAAKAGSSPPLEALSISAPVVRSRHRYWPCAALHSPSIAARPRAAKPAVLRGDLRLAERVGERGEIGAAAEQDGVEAGVDHLERRRIVQLRVVPAEPAEVLDQPEVAVVLRLGRPVRRIGVLGVAAGVGRDALGRHALEGLVPVDRVVAARLPGMQDRDQPLAARDRGWRRTSGARRRSSAAAPAARASAAAPVGGALARAAAPRSRRPAAG